MDLSRVAIVVEHTITSRGAVNTDGVSEFSYNLMASEMIGCDVYLLDSKLSYYLARQKLKYKLKKYDLVLNLHFNSSEHRGVKGCEAIYWHSNNKAKELATDYINIIAATFGSKPRQAKAMMYRSQRGYWSIKAVRCMSLILEPNFGSNTDETERFRNVKMYADAVKKFLYRI